MAKMEITIEKIIDAIGRENVGKKDILQKYKLNIFLTEIYQDYKEELIRDYYRWKHWYTSRETGYSFQFYLSNDAQSTYALLLETNETKKYFEQIQKNGPGIPEGKDYVAILQLMAAILVEKTKIDWYAGLPEFEGL